MYCCYICLNLLLASLINLEKGLVGFWVVFLVEFHAIDPHWLAMVLPQQHISELMPMQKYPLLASNYSSGGKNRHTKNTKLNNLFSLHSSSIYRTEI